MTRTDEQRREHRNYMQRRRREDPVFAEKQRESQRAYAARMRIENPERLRLASAKYYASEAGKAKQKAWKKANAEKYKATQDAARWKRPVVYMVAGARRRAKVKGIEFDLLVSDVHVPSHCPVLGIELKFNRGSPKPDSPTIDRVDNNKGYTRDNIRVISHRANSLKSNASLGELLAVYEYVLDEMSTVKEGRA